MTEEEWLNGMRGLPDAAILKIHFELQDKIKKHYKLRSVGGNLQKAIHFCQQQIALGPLSMSALKNKQTMCHGGEFYAPAHHGYRQYIIILRREKDFEALSKLELKRISEGWAE
ncbi:hypothetical protein M8013_14270 [Enterobacteriaceae bacterium H4N4]|uniref:Uncharacterized protein n=1 Tax=Silvania confinis TaxID=2926470 RepID=A0A9J6QNU1_9ENTR|nr:hypothetical protein [Silvania confinis]MCU6669909.1 hypothetical protein [Silvania confinis]